MNSTALVRPATADDFISVVQLLQSENLPVEDLKANLPHFFVIGDKNTVFGAIGLEVYGTDGLLRSMIVDSNYRGLSLAKKLIDNLFEYAEKNGLNTIYLITTTAEKYFGGRGFQPVSRDKVPASIAATSEFTSLCPSTATVMVKEL